MFVQAGWTKASEGAIPVTDGKGLTDYSAYKYAGRKAAKSVLDIAYPTKTNDAYMGMKSVLLQEAYEYGGSQYPSVLRWYDGRKFLCGTSGTSHCMTIYISELKDLETYNADKAVIRSSSTQILSDCTAIWYHGSVSGNAVAEG